jgi:hypothetical protein
LQARIRRSETSRLKENERPRHFEGGKNVKNELTLHFGNATNERGRLGENAKIEVDRSPTNVKTDRNRLRKIGTANVNQLLRLKSELNR